MEAKLPPACGYSFLKKTIIEKVLPSENAQDEFLQISLSTIRKGRLSQEPTRFPLPEAKLMISSDYFFNSLRQWLMRTNAVQLANTAIMARGAIKMYTLSNAVQS